MLAPAHHWCSSWVLKNTFYWDIYPLICLVNAHLSFRFPLNCHFLRSFNWTLVPGEKPESLRDISSLFHWFTSDKEVPTERNFGCDYPCEPVSMVQRPVWWAHKLEAVFWDGSFLLKWLLERVLGPKEIVHQTKPNLPIKQLKRVRPADLCITEHWYLPPRVFIVENRNGNTLILSYVRF